MGSSQRLNFASKKEAKGPSSRLLAESFTAIEVTTLVDKTQEFCSVGEDLKSNSGDPRTA